MPIARVDDRNWSALTLGERIRQIEVEGYLVLPDLLSAEEVAHLKRETARFETRAVDYSVHQQVRPNVQFLGGEVSRLAAHPPAMAFLQALMGDDIIAMSYHYARSEPGHPGISLHADGQPYGSEIFGYEGSCPWLVRVLFRHHDLPWQRRHLSHLGADLPPRLEDDDRRSARVHFARLRNRTRRKARAFAATDADVGGTSLPRHHGDDAKRQKLSGSAGV